MVWVKENQIKKIRIHINEDLNSFIETDENDELIDEINKDLELEGSVWKETQKSSNIFK